MAASPHVGANSRVSLLSTLDMGIYFTVTLLATLGGLYVLMIILFSVAWGGSHDISADCVLSLGTLSTAMLLIGLFGNGSQRTVFSILTILGATFVPCVIVFLFFGPLFHGVFRTLGEIPLSWLMFLLVDLSAIVLSVAKLKQLQGVTNLSLAD